MATTRVVAFRGATLAPARVTAPRTSLAKVSFRASRPAQLQSEFLAPVAALKGLCATFTRWVLDPLQSAVRHLGRVPLLVEANRKKGLGCTLHGTRRKRARVSGFRARMATVGGRKVLKQRRAKGRSNLLPASVPKIK